MKTEQNKLKIISTFNGVGAFTDGLKLSNTNYTIDTVCEIDKRANETYYHNNKKSNHIDNINELLETIEPNKKIDILVQTPPCQSFSLAGRRKGFESQNGNLFITAIQLQKKIDANVVIYENVRGLTNHNKYKNKNNIGQFVGIYDSLINEGFKIGGTFYSIEKTLLEDDRYNYYWKIINSYDMGLPQNRERIFIIGIKKELDNGFTFPNNKSLQFKVSDILEKNVDDSYFSKYPDSFIKLKEPSNRKNKSILSTYGNYTNTSYYSSSRIHNPIVSSCLVTSENSWFLINGKVRRLTPAEMLKIHGFNDNFNFPSTMGKTIRIKQMGNTVSPGVYCELIKEIKSTLNYNFSIPQQNPTSFILVSEKHKEDTMKTEQNNLTNKHISLTKNIIIKDRTVGKMVSGEFEIDYLNIKDIKGDEYSKLLEQNKLTLNLIINVYKSKEDKKNNIIEKTLIRQIDSLTKLGIRNKVNNTYRYKINKNIPKPIHTVEQLKGRKVLYTRNGGKGSFENQFTKVFDNMGAKHNTVVDSFYGGGGFTIKNIEKLQFDKWICNDLDIFVYKTNLGVKNNFQKVINHWKDYRDSYYRKMTKKVYNSKSRHLTKELREEGLLPLRNFYKDRVRELDNNKHIYSNEQIAALYIFVMGLTVNGILRTDKDGSLHVSSYNMAIKITDRVDAITYYSYIFNKHNVEFRNENVFDLIDTVDKDSLLYLDPPYVDTDIDYGFDGTNGFNVELIEKTKKFNKVIYSNEDGKTLDNLGIVDCFEDYLTFGRNNTLGMNKKTGKYSNNKKDVMEFLGYRISSNSVDFNNLSKAA